MYYKKEILKFLNDNKISFEHIEHKAVYSVNETDDIILPHKESDAKNLFLRDDKKKNYYLLTVVSDKSVNLKKFAQLFGLRRLSFANPDDLYKNLKITPGSVSPFCLLNNEEKNVKFFIDSDFIKNDLIGCHPNDNTATLFLSAKSLLNIINNIGIKTEIFDFNEVKNDN